MSTFFLAIICELESFYLPLHGQIKQPIFWESIIMTLSVIIVNYNVKHYVSQCIDSALWALHGIDGEIFVVDNHSSDGSVKHLRKRFPEVKVMASNHNLGFSRANNIALKQARGKYVLLLNPDTIVKENTFRDCVRFMEEHEDCGALGVCQRNVDGSRANESRRGLPTPMTSFYKMIGLTARFPHHPSFARYYMGHLPWNEVGEIDCISGAFFFARKEAVEKAGYMNEDYFMYGEDIDLSYCVKKLGYKNYFLPTDIIHYKGESTHKTSFRYVHVFYQAMIIFMSKHMRGVSLLLKYPLMFAVYFKAFIALIGILSKKTKKMLGFTSAENRIKQKYLFVVKEENLEDCKQLALDNAFDADFITVNNAADEGAKIDHQQYVGDNDLLTVVYDRSAFFFSQIIDRFTEGEQGNVQMGILHPSRRVLVTREECYEY